MKDISKLAANLIAEQVSGKKKNFDAPIARGEGPDLRDVKIPSSMQIMILEQSFGIKQPKVEVKEEVKEQVLTEETKVEEKPKSKSPDELLAEFTEIVVKARELLGEMCSAGMLGTSMAPSKKVKKKYKYRKVP